MKYSLADLCREMLQATNELKEGELVTVHFGSWQERKEVMDYMAAHYGAGNLQRIEFGLYN
jgi:hypothetical protein